MLARLRSRRRDRLAAGRGGGRPVGRCAGRGPARVWPGARTRAASARRPPPPSAVSDVSREAPGRILAPRLRVSLPPGTPELRSTSFTARATVTGLTAQRDNCPARRAGCPLAAGVHGPKFILSEDAPWGASRIRWRSAGGKGPTIKEESVSLRRHTLRIVGMLTVLAMAFGVFAGAASAKKMSPRQKAKVRNELRRAVKKNPRVVKRSSFLKKARLVDFKLPVTIRVRRASNGDPTNVQPAELHQQRAGDQHGDAGPRSVAGDAYARARRSAAGRDRVRGLVRRRWTRQRQAEPEVGWRGAGLRPEVDVHLAADELGHLDTAD